MRVIIILIIFFIPLFGVSQYVRKTELTELHIDSSGYSLDSVIILGSGTNATRIFLDQLHALLIKKLRSKKIHSTYHYFATKEEQAIFIDSVAKKGNKAILIFQPEEDGVLYSKSASKNAASRVLFGTQGLRTNMKYKQKFNVELFTNKENKTILWSASLNVEGDPSLPEIAKEASAKIISSFKKNQFL